MADFFLSDVHLRVDRPDRDRRLVSFLETCEPTDRLFIVGDLCDFWYATQEFRGGNAITPGLEALRAARAAGAEITLLVGNHDTWLADFYSSRLGLNVVDEPLMVDSYGLRVRLEHGHRNRKKKPWKAFLEGYTFYRSFSLLPGPIARAAQNTLDSVNERTRARAEIEMTQAFESFSQALDPRPDLAVFGHVHRRHDRALPGVRVIVLGDWTEDTSYLRIDDRGAILVYQAAEKAPAPSTTLSSSET